MSALKNRLGEDRHEGIEDDGQTGFFHALHQNLFEVDRINEQELRRSSFSPEDVTTALEDAGKFRELAYQFLRQR